MAVLLRVRWTDHALEKASLSSIALLDVEQIVIEQHHARRRNHRAADWRVRRSELVVLYNHPDRGDPGCARIVTLWRRR